MRIKLISLTPPGVIHIPSNNHVITPVGSGMFGLRGKGWSLALPRLNVRHVQKLGTGCFRERLKGSSR